jgi:vesicle-fusing ATPase
LLVFVTTSKASVLRMLEIDTDFAKKVPVPAVSTLNELGPILDQSGVINPEDIRGALSAIRQRTGSDTVNVGVKAVLDCLFEARAGGEDFNIVETFSELLIEKIQEASA